MISFQRVGPKVLAVALAASLAAAAPAAAVYYGHSHKHNHVVYHTHDHNPKGSHTHAASFWSPPATPPNTKLKNVIVLISDGWGYNTISATDYYTAGKGAAQGYEQFPVSLPMATFPDEPTAGYDPAMATADFNYVKLNPTDSASAGTAMSTGVKTYNAAIGVDNDFSRLENVLERAAKLNKSTGVVSTVEWSHATPASYVAHNASRNDYAGIAREMVNTSTVDVIMGAGHPYYTDSNVATTTVLNSAKYVGGIETWDALVAGTAGGNADKAPGVERWKLIQTKAEFEALATARTTPKRVLGTTQVATTNQQNRGGDKMANADVVPMNAGVPSLATMTRGALNVLDNDPDGLFLMVEGGAVDWAGHANQKGRIIEEQRDFNAAVDAAVEWVNRNSNWNETLVIVTGDHETGYVTGPTASQSTTPAGPVYDAIDNNGIGVMPSFKFNSTDHTNQVIPFFAKGKAADDFGGLATGWDHYRGRYIDNTACASVIFKYWR